MITLLNALIPLDQVRQQQSTQGRGYSECLGNKRQAPERIEAICMRLALRVLHVARCDFLEGNYPRFDGNPGDSQCQVRAANLYAISQNKGKIIEQMDQLCIRSGLPLSADYSGKGVIGLAAMVNMMVSSQKEQALSKAREQFDQLQVAFEVQFLLQSYLSEIMREVVEVSERGTVLTRGNGTRLDRIETALKAFPAIQNAILKYNQKELSRNSVLYLQALIPEENFYLRQVTSIEGRVVPERTFSCLFSTTQAVLRFVKGIICLREIVPKLNKPIDPKRCQLQNTRPPKEIYIQMPGETVIAAPTGDLFVVIEAEIPDMDFAREYIVNNGLTQAILAQAAICPPFEKGTTAADLPERVQPIAARCAANQPPFTVDHYFVEKVRDAQ